MPLECQLILKVGHASRLPRQSLVLVLAVLGCFVGLHSLPVCAQTPAQPAPASTVATNTPIVPAFEVRRYEVIGNTIFGQPSIEQLMRDAIGTNVSLPQIRRALVKLQEAYRERGYTRVAVTLPRQALTDRTVKVLVAEGPDISKPQTTPTPALESWAVPTYDVQHFEVRGNTALSAEEIDRILGPIAGPGVSVEQIQKALGQLQAAYRERGFTRASVSLPEQVLTDSTVAIAIDEGRSLEAELAALAAKTNVAPVPKPPPARTFVVRHYEVIGNTLLSYDVLAQVFTNAVGPAVTLQQIQKALGELQLAYRERGFATVAVGLPQQQLTNAVVKVQVTEGVLVGVRVTGNRYFSSNNVMHALPSLSTNVQLNSRVFQRELDIANQNRDRQIYPTIGPGPEPGTSDLTLRVKDRLPLHGRIDLNNYNTPGTPDWRINASAQYNNLWQLEHQVGLSYGFTPEAFKSKGLMSDYFFNRPLVSYYGAYYRMPFGSPQSVAEQISGSTSFGFDEASRQFRMPPAGSRPDLTIYISGSSSDTGVQHGPATLISQTPLLTIVSQDSGQDLSINQSAGAQLNIPHVIDDNRRFGFSAGAVVKGYSLESFNTNNFIITTVVTNSQGSQTIRSVVSSPQPNSRDETVYAPITLGGDYSQTDKSGTFSANLTLGGNFVGQNSDYAALGTSPDAKAAFGKANLTLTRDQKIFGNWSLLLRANGQAATGPLISIEQFPLGGVNSVRGYFEGDVYGEDGWFGSVELRTPFLATQVPTWSDPVPLWLRASVFVDGGQAFLLDPNAGLTPTTSLLGTGFGVSGNINNHFDVKITVGWPLRDSANTSAYEPSVYFSLGGQF